MAAAISKIDGYRIPPEFTFERRRSSSSIEWQRISSSLCNYSRVNIKIRRQRNTHRLPKLLLMATSSSSSKAAVASSSSSSSAAGSSRSTYEVFLSFYGKDVRTNFADHLYNSLVYAGIRTFRDDEELQKGNRIGPELHDAIQQSKISIPILSENYASSKWCLNELTQISECSRRTMEQMIVLPIFYKVEPRDVRNQTGRYAKAFEEHRQRFDETTVQKWKKALKEVGELDGWHSKEDTYEGKLIKSVVNKVWSTLNKRPLIVSDSLVGIQAHIKEMLMLLDIDSDDRKIVGIHGLGGIGKTTIARAVYNAVFHHFEGYSFIENIQENAQKHGLPHLQNQLIFDILKQENRNITSVGDGKDVIQQRFRNRKVLIVLDDVDQGSQAKSLVGDREWFGIGSKIIITSRNKDILIAQKSDRIYEPNEMDLDDSLELFSHHAFGRDWPKGDYLDISKAMVKTTGGLPLALEVIGSSLYCLKEKSKWEDMLKNLQKDPNNGIMKSLKISYDGLNEEEKQMFLDIAIFFIGMKKDIACHIWDGCGFSPELRLDALCVRSLVTISEDGELRMHDQLRDLGREIVRQESIKEPGKRTRIWSEEEVLDVLNTQKGTSNVEGLIIDFKGRSESHCLMSKGFAKMTKLKLLQVDYAHFSRNFTYSFSELRWLSWKGCPSQYVQTNFRPQKLVVLDLSHSKITEHWKGWNDIKMAANLKVLSLMFCHELSITPDLSENGHLEVLILKDCKNLVGIDASIGYLRNLLTLDISDCESLLDLPTEVCQMTSLERLDLKGCKCLNKLPEKLDRMISLKTLDLSGCERLEYLQNLPRHLEVLILKDCKNLVGIDTSIGYLWNLVILDISGCESLVDLPIEVCQLTSLERLDLKGCKSLNKLPEELGGMISLKTLDLSGYDRLESLPNLPSSLKSLDASYCELISSFPPMLSNLEKLEVLCLRGCKKLLTLSNLPLSLTSLDVSGCSSIQHIPRLPSSLIRLDVSGCSSIQHIPRLPSSLIRLDVSGCSSIHYILNLPSSLTRLDVSRCSSLRFIPSLPSSLTSLDISFCSSIQYISSLPSGLISLYAISCRSMIKLSSKSGGLRNLKVLWLDGCNSLEEIEGIDEEGLESLEFFTMRWCSLKNLPKLRGSKKLRKLKLDHCHIIPDMEGEGMESLEELEIVSCHLLRKIPNLSDSKQLRKLEINACTELSKIEGLEDCQCLEILSIRQCYSMKRLPDLSKLNKLQVLSIEGCEKFAKIPGLDRLESLRELKIRGCIAIERLPDLSNLNNLQVLRIEGCEKFTEIPGLDRLESLRELKIGGCIAIERLPDLSNLKKLEELRAIDCRMLTEIKAVNGLESLKLLEIMGCISLQNFPKLTNSRLLWDLRGNWRRAATTVEDKVIDHQIYSRSDPLPRVASIIILGAAFAMTWFMCIQFYQLYWKVHLP